MHNTQGARHNALVIAGQRKVVRNRVACGIAVRGGVGTDAPTRKRLLRGRAQKMCSLGRTRGILDQSVARDDRGSRAGKHDQGAGNESAAKRLHLFVVALPVQKVVQQDCVDAHQNEEGTDPNSKRHLLALRLPIRCAAKYAIQGDRATVTTMVTQWQSVQMSNMK